MGEIGTTEPFGSVVEGITESAGLVASGLGMTTPPEVIDAGTDTPAPELSLGSVVFEGDVPVSTGVEGLELSFPPSSSLPSSPVPPVEVGAGMTTPFDVIGGRSSSAGLEEEEVLLEEVLSPTGSETPPLTPGLASVGRP